MIKKLQEKYAEQWRTNRKPTELRIHPSDLAKLEQELGYFVYAPHADDVHVDTFMGVKVIPDRFVKIGEPFIK